MKKSKTNSASDPDHLVTDEFLDGVKRLIANRNERDAYLVERLGVFDASIAAQLLEEYPDLTVEKAIELVLSGA